MKTKKSISFLTILVQFLLTLLKFFAKKHSNEENIKQQMEIEKAKAELKKALAEGRITDAAYWKNKLNQLLTVILAVMLSGCQTLRPETPSHTVVLGERINKVSPGDKLTVPPLTPPAKQWYLIDDHGLYQWLDIDLKKK